MRLLCAIRTATPVDLVSPAFAPTACAGELALRCRCFVRANEQELAVSLQKVVLHLQRLAVLAARKRSKPGTWPCVVLCRLVCWPPLEMRMVVPHPALVCSCWLAQPTLCSVSLLLRRRRRWREEAQEKAEEARAQGLWRSRRRQALSKPARSSFSHLVLILICCQAADSASARMLSMPVFTWLCCVFVCGRRGQRRSQGRGQVGGQGRTQRQWCVSI